MNANSFHMFYHFDYINSYNDTKTFQILSTVEIENLSIYSSPTALSQNKYFIYKYSRN